MEEAYIARFPLGNRADAVANVSSWVVLNPEPYNTSNTMPRNLADVLPTFCPPHACHFFANSKQPGFISTRKDDAKASRANFATRITGLARIRR